MGSKPESCVLQLSGFHVPPITRGRDVDPEFGRLYSKQ